MPHGNRAGDRGRLFIANCTKWHRQRLSYQLDFRLRQGALGYFSKRITAPASLWARLTLLPRDTPRSHGVSPQKAQATAAALTWLLQCPTPSMGSALPLHPGSASPASQTAPSLCSNACLVLATNYCIVQNRQQGDVLRSYVSEEKAIWCNISAGYFQQFTKLKLFYKSLLVARINSNWKRSINQNCAWMAGMLLESPSFSIPAGFVTSLIKLSWHVSHFLLLQDDLPT